MLAIAETKKRILRMYENCVEKALKVVDKAIDNFFTLKYYRLNRRIGIPPEKVPKTTSPRKNRASKKD